MRTHYLDVGLSIGVLNHNGKGVLKRCVDAALAQRAPVPTEVFVLDNASTDNSWQDVNCRIARANGRHQFITGLNETLYAAQFPAILFVSNDVFLHDGAAAALWTALRDCPDAIIQPTLQNLDGSYNNIGLDYRWPGYGAGRKRFKGTGVLEPIEIFTTGCFIISRKTFLEIGRFDTELAPAYYEDVDYSIRAAAYGIKRLVHTKATATHVSTHTFKKVYTRTELSGICRKNRRYVVGKYYEGLDKWSRLATLGVGDGLAWAAGNWRRLTKHPVS